MKSPALAHVSSLAALALTLMLGVSALPHAASAQAPPARTKAAAKPERARIQLLLSAHHELPDRALFEGASDQARAHLLDFATDLDVFPLYRYRALEALGAYYADDQVLRLYASVLKDAGSERAQHRVMLLAARFFGDQATGLLTPFLSDKNIQLRITAVEALALIHSETSRAMLRAAASSEPDPGLATRMVRAAAGVK